MAVGQTRQPSNIFDVEGVERFGEIQQIPEFPQGTQSIVKKPPCLAGNPPTECLRSMRRDTQDNFSQLRRHARNPLLRQSGRQGVYLPRQLIRRLPGWEVSVARCTRCLVAHLATLAVWLTTPGWRLLVADMEQFQNLGSYRLKLNTGILQDLCSDPITISKQA